MLRRTITNEILKVLFIIMPKDSIPQNKYSKRCLSTEAHETLWEESKKGYVNGTGNYSCKLEDDHIAVLLKLVYI